MYHEGQRELQDRFASRALADRLDEKLRRERFNDADKAFVEASPFFFLATADADGRPDSRAACRASYASARPIC